MATTVCLKHFSHIEAIVEMYRCLAPPVVEITGDDQSLVGRYGSYVLHQPAELFISLEVEQTEMNTDDVQHLTCIRYPRNSMQQTATGPACQCDIDVLPFCNGEFTEYGIAMMTSLIDRIFTVSMIRPDSVGEEFHLVVIGPAGDRFTAAGVFPMDLLQQYDVRCDITQIIFYRMQYESAITDVHTFMDVISEYFYG